MSQAPGPRQEPGESENRSAGERQASPDGPPADGSLARAVLRGDETALEGFVVRMRCIPRILGALNARVGRPFDQHELADLSQEVLVLVWRKLPSFDGKASLESWVYRIAFYTLMNALRGRRRRGVVSLGFEEWQTGGEERESPWDFELLYAALEELAPDERQVLELKHFQGLTFVEIGGRLAVSDNTVKTRYYRARLHLHRRLRALDHTLPELAPERGTR